MTQAEPQLEALKSKMTQQQIKDMAEIVSNEVKRREGMKRSAMAGKKSTVTSSRMSNNLPHDSLGEMYADVDEKVRALRAKKSAEKIGRLEDAIRAKTMEGRAGRGFRGGRAAQFSRRIPSGFPFSRKLLLGGGVLALAVVKVLTGMGVVDAAVVPPTRASLASPRIPAANGAIPIEQELFPGEPPRAAAVEQPERHDAYPIAAAEPVRSGGSAAGSDPSERQLATVRGMPMERELLTELDARRVELEKRKTQLDDRENQIREQSRALQERLGELRILTAKLSESRKESENQHDARMEQLSQVYSSMAPNEAAPLIAKLDERIALALLKRMPGKRMGQILSAMEQDRAVQLTKELTEQKLAGDVSIRE